MSEEDWLGRCEDYRPMLQFLQGKTSDRKFRLFAVACCRRIWHLLPDERCRKAVEVAEQFSDGMASEQDLQRAIVTASRSAEENEVHSVGQPFWMGQGIYSAVRTAVYVAVPSAYEASVSAGRTYHTAALGSAGDSIRSAVSVEVHRYRITLIHDIFGNPFRPVTLDPQCLTVPVQALAQAIYDDRTFAQLPVLADSLEEAGCDQADILKHLRNDGEHVRGCWALDLVLGRE